MGEQPAQRRFRAMCHSLACLLMQAWVNQRNIARERGGIRHGHGRRCMLIQASSRILQKSRSREGRLQTQMPCKLHAAW